MPGPKSEPEGGKTRSNRFKKKHTLRGDNGDHKRGSQNRNKKYRVVHRGDR